MARRRGIGRLAGSLAAVWVLSSCDPQGGGDDDDTGSHDASGTDGGTDESTAASESDDGDAATCREPTQSCDRNADCCGFDSDLPSGAGLCVSGFDDPPRQCTPVCRANAECPQDQCCARLQSNADHGVCGSCDRLPFLAEDYQACINGLELYCLCAIAADTPCSRDELMDYRRQCGRGVPSWTQFFVCYTDNPHLSCGEVEQMCPDRPGS